jgi:hypothetical protein
MKYVLIEVLEWTVCLLAVGGMVSAMWVML